MRWFYPEDGTRPVIDPERMIRGKYPDGQAPKLPGKAVVFCLSRGLPLLEERFSARLLLEKLPGFITHSRVLGVDGHPESCFLHGGYGAPQIACTVETLHVLGVTELLLVGLAGGFGEDVRVGEVLIPHEIWSEEGTSRHYREESGFAKADPAQSEALERFLAARGFSVSNQPTVTTDAVYRQTFFKEALWREKGCVAVDMETSAAVNVCDFYGMKSAVALMVSDRHPLSEGAPPWAWGGTEFPALRDDFLAACVEFSRAEG